MALHKARVVWEANKLILVLCIIQPAESGLYAGGCVRLL